MPALAISTTNEKKDPSDHHLIGVNIRLKGAEGNILEYMSRKRSQFSPDKFRNMLKNSQWAEFYVITSLVKANKWFEEILCTILQELSPLRIVQPNQKKKKN